MNYQQIGDTEALRELINAEFIAQVEAFMDRPWPPLKRDLAALINIRIAAINALDKKETAR